MAYCGSSVGTWGSPAVFQIQTLATAPADLSTCQFVLMPGSEYTTILQLAQQEAFQRGLQQGSTTGIPSTVTELQIKEPEFNVERSQDMMEMFWAFVLVLVSIWGLKQLLNLFGTDSDKD